MRFSKYHGLGNDYLVVRPHDLGGRDPPDVARALCRRRHGIGADGLLVGPHRDASDGHRVSIYNPDGSEAEKSGNGLRIFARYLFDHGAVSADSPFSIRTIGGAVDACVLDGGRTVRLGMGRASFRSDDLAMAGPAREVLCEVISPLGRDMTFCGVSLGNPHCVVVSEGASTDENVRLYGPFIEKDARFLNRTNVQFLCVIDRTTIQIRIWERGAGETLASGSSAVAAACVARKLGTVERGIRVRMAGGELFVEIDDDYQTRLTGAVSAVGEGVVSPTVFEA